MPSSYECGRYPTGVPGTCAHCRVTWLRLYTPATHCCIKLNVGRQNDHSFRTYITLLVAIAPSYRASSPLHPTSTISPTTSPMRSATVLSLVLGGTALPVLCDTAFPHYGRPRMVVRDESTSSSTLSSTSSVSSPPYSPTAFPMFQMSSGKYTVRSSIAPTC